MWRITYCGYYITKNTRPYRTISDVQSNIRHLGREMEIGGTKNLKKMKEVCSRKLTSLSSQVVFPCRQPFPPAFLLLFCPFTSHSSSFSSSSSSVLIETAPLFLFLLFYLCVWLLFWRNYTVLWWTMLLVYNSTKILIYLKLLSQ